MTIAERPLDGAKQREAEAPAAPRSPRGRSQNVVAEIAERRRADVREEMARLTLDDHLAAAAATPPPRDLLTRLASPGLHLIAEIKRSSPSAGEIAGPGDDIVARARAYEAGGAAAISVLCEPHWFGGSVDDLRAVRAAVSVPVLAKEFVVEDIQLPHLRAAGADLVLLLAVLHPAKRLARLVDRALEIGLEPLVEAHDERELARALATNARLIGINNRDLRTLGGRHRPRDPAAGARPRRSTRRRRVRRPRSGHGRRLARGGVRRRAGRRGAGQSRRPAGCGRGVRRRGSPAHRSREPRGDRPREDLRHHRRRGSPRRGSLPVPTRSG